MSMPDPLQRLNQMTSEDCTRELLGACHSTRWAETMSAARPFADPDALFQAATRAWEGVEEGDVLEAFDGHPQIGDLSALRNKYATTASAEQGQVAAADEATLLELKQLNDEYLQKNGFIFIVCATGKSAAEMLELLKARIGNDRNTELRNGAIEQGKITRLRLEKLVES